MVVKCLCVQYVYFYNGNKSSKNASSRRLLGGPAKINQAFQSAPGEIQGAFISCISNYAITMQVILLEERCKRVMNHFRHCHGNRKLKTLATAVVVTAFEQLGGYCWQGIVGNNHVQ